MKRDNLSLVDNTLDQPVTAEELNAIIELQAMQSDQITFNVAYAWRLYLSLKALEKLERENIQLQADNLKLQCLNEELKHKTALREKPETVEKKYRLTRDIEDLGFHKGRECYLNRHGYWAVKNTAEESTLIGYKNAIDPTLIEEIKPVEIWVTLYEQGWGVGHASKEEALKYCKGVKTCRFIHVADE